MYFPEEIVLENLDFSGSELSKKLNRLLNTFGKQAIENKLESLSETHGIKITKVNPAYTSQTCPCCGYVAKNNRRNQKEFKCKFCGFAANADVTGSKNVLARSSRKDLSDIYVGRKKILGKIVEDFTERYPCLYSKAKELISKNPYFVGKVFLDYDQNNSLCKTCV